MRDQNSDQIQEANPFSPPPLSPRPYPVSIRAYKQKDYEYISSFNRTVQAGLRATGDELLKQRSDSESEYCFIRSSVEYGSSTGFASSSSPVGSYGKDDMALMEVENHHHHHLFSAQMSSDSAQMTEHFPELHAELIAEKLDSIAESPSPTEEISAQVKEPIRSQAPEARARPRQVQTQQRAVLPEFGAWDTQNPSSGEYTAIFRGLRDKKKAGALPAQALPACASPSTPSVFESVGDAQALPACASPTDSKTEGVLEPPSIQSIAKEPHHSKPQVRKYSSIAKDASQQEGACHLKYPWKWTFCCKEASVLDA